MMCSDSERGMGVYNPVKNQLPYGGAVNIHGEIIWRVTEDEFNEMRKHLESIFNEGL